MRKALKTISIIFLVVFIISYPLFRWESGTPNTSILNGLQDKNINTLELIVGNIYYNITER